MILYYIILYYILLYYIILIILYYIILYYIILYYIILYYISYHIISYIIFHLRSDFYFITMFHKELFTENLQHITTYSLTNNSFQASLYKSMNNLIVRCSFKLVTTVSFL